MNNINGPLKVGIGGGIGTGKSYVAHVLKNMASNPY